MKQSRLMSLLESCGNTGSGLIVSLLAQGYILAWLLGVQISLAHNVTFALIMTALSIVRSYLWRRFMEAVGVRLKLSRFAQLVLAERARQVSGERFSAEHDDLECWPGELESMAAAYALSAANGSPAAGAPPACWPISDTWWKPAGVQRDLVKAGALLLAAGDRFDRMRRKK